MGKVLTEGWEKDDHNFSALSLGKSCQLFEKACTYVLPELAVLTVDIKHEIKFKKTTGRNIFLVVYI